MNLPRVLLLVPCFFISSAVLADSAFEGLKFEQQKQKVLLDVKKACPPQKNMSDDAWVNKILSSEANKNHIREATVALDRNNQQNYWDAVGKVECSDM